MSESHVSRMVADRVAMTNTVTGAIRMHGPEVAAVVEKTLFPAGAPSGLSDADKIKTLGAYP